MKIEFTKQDGNKLDLVLSIFLVIVLSGSIPVIIFGFDDFLNSPNLDDLYNQYKIVQQLAEMVTLFLVCILAVISYIITMVSVDIYIIAKKFNVEEK